MVPYHLARADPKLVQSLYAHGKISNEGRAYALNFLIPHRAWGLWVSRILLSLGTLLVLSGIIYFFAFNWAAITPAIKFATLQASIVVAITGACVLSLNSLWGRTLLLSASVLVGIFMAVFGQVYQTGADAYQLFMMWSLFTFGWTVISKFAPQWLFWLLITNTWLVLWWEQAALPSHEMEYMIFAYMAIFNGIALGSAEYFATFPRHAWLMIRWIRIVLVAVTLFVMLIPIFAFILQPGRMTLSILLGSGMGTIGHGLFFYYYRYKRPDMEALAMTILSLCIIVITICFRIHFECDLGDKWIFFTMGLTTLIVFTVGIVYLKKASKKMLNPSDHERVQP